MKPNELFSGRRHSTGTTRAMAAKARLAPRETGRGGSRRRKDRGIAGTNCPVCGMPQKARRGTLVTCPHIKVETVRAFIKPPSSK